jgi:hypothetical protein
MEEIGCNECRFWEKQEVDNSLGYCRRYAPRPSSSTPFISWPITRSYDWCGEYEVWEKVVWKEEAK